MIPALLGIYIPFFIVSALVLAIIYSDNSIHQPKFLDGLEREGRVVVGVLVGLVWPIVALHLLVKHTPGVVRGLGRGIAQVYRALAPAKVELPRAQVRK